MADVAGGQAADLSSGNCRAGVTIEGSFCADGCLVPFTGSTGGTDAQDAAGTSARGGAERGPWGDAAGSGQLPGMAAGVHMRKGVASEVSRWQRRAGSTV